MSTLLTRDEFREAVFARDSHKCVMCHVPAQDAHHIMERRLFPDGGYYLDNGASVCGDCHFRCESTEISTDEVRAAAGIQTVVLPPHLYRDQDYDKWGNPILDSGSRLRGELFYDESVQRALHSHFGHQMEMVFQRYVKYPRTHHVPWSPTPSKDDRVWSDTTALQGKEVVVTEKMDGENTTMYFDYIHARSVDGRSHPSRDWVSNFWATHVAYQIAPDWRICGENLYAEHSISYTLPTYFMGFSIWVNDVCTGWDDTVLYFELLGITPVPVLYRGSFDEDRIQALKVNYDTSEGYVVRPVTPFSLKDFSTHVGKFVRPNHVQTTKHWMHGQPITPNTLTSQV